MAVKESKKRIVITLEKELIEIIKNNSTKNNRTISKEISLIVEEYYKKENSNKFS